MMNVVKQELLASLPLDSYLNTDEEVIFQFAKEDFMVDDLFEKNMVHAKFQKNPVIYFMDKMGEPQFIVIDSWSRQNQLENVHKSPILGLSDIFNDYSNKVRLFGKIYISRFY